MLLLTLGQEIIVDTPGPTFEEVPDAAAPPVPVEVPAVLDIPAPPVLADVPAAAKRRRLRGKQAPP